MFYVILFPFKNHQITIGTCGGNPMISLRLMEDTMEDYTAMHNWFLEPEL